MSDFTKIPIDASQWKSDIDFFESINNALGAPSWHGNNINALIDSMVHGDVNSIIPPYEITFLNISKIDSHLRNKIGQYISILNDSIREEKLQDVIKLVYD